MEDKLHLHHAKRRIIHRRPIKSISKYQSRIAQIYHFGPYLNCIKENTISATKVIVYRFDTVQQPTP